jgi:hypothetical protein
MTFKYHYSIFALIFFMTGCVQSKKIEKSLTVNQQYIGWYVGTSNGQFFIIERNGLFKKDIAIKLPEYFQACNIFQVLDTSCDNEKNKKRYFIVGRDDRVTFDQKTFIFRAKGIYGGIINNNPSAEIKNIHYKIKARYSNKSIKAVWLDNLTTIKNLVLFSNCSDDSIRYPECTITSCNVQCHTTYAMNRPE